MIKRNGTWTAPLQVSTMLHKFREKKRNLKIAKTLKMTGKVETSTINREVRKTMIAVLPVEVTANITHINSQQTKPLKWWKRMAYISWSFERGKEKKQPLFCKIRPCKQRQEKRFERVEIKNYGETETN